jgi:hypothetical protein
MGGNGWDEAEGSRLPRVYGNKGFRAAVVKENLAAPLVSGKCKAPPCWPFGAEEARGTSGEVGFGARMNDGCCCVKPGSVDQEANVSRSGVGIQKRRPRRRINCPGSSCGHKWKRWRAVEAVARMVTSGWIRPWARAVLSGWSQIGGFGGPHTLRIFPLGGTLPGSGSSLIAAQHVHSRNGQWQVQDWWRLSKNRIRGRRG